LQNLLQPVIELHVGVAAQLAEDGGAFHGFVRKAVEFAKQGNPADLAHVLSLPMIAPHPGRGNFSGESTTNLFLQHWSVR
jgi:hypothetical protein